MVGESGENGEKDDASAALGGSEVGGVDDFERGGVACVLQSFLDIGGHRPFDAVYLGGGESGDVFHDDGGGSDHLDDFEEPGDTESPVVFQTSPAPHAGPALAGWSSCDDVYWSVGEKFLL